jgi:hypothetical protein
MRYRRRRSAGSGGRARHARRSGLFASVPVCKFVLCELREASMRFLVKVAIPVEAGNAAAKKDGFKVIQTILEQQKPEAAYFIAEGGRRTGILVIDMKDPSDLPRIAEPWFLALNASIEATPAMIPEDLAKAAPAIEQAVKAFG